MTIPKTGRTVAARTKAASLRVGLAATAAFLLVLIGARAGASAADAAGPGCAPDRHAVAYHAGGALVTPKGDLPIPCAVVAGTSIDTTAVSVSRDGTVVYAPISTGAAAAPAITISKDKGATWAVQTPMLQPETGSGIVWMDIDPQTNRIWFAMVGPVKPPCAKSDDTLAQVAWSDDEGKSWHSPAGDPAACRQLQGGMSIVEGPAPKGQPQPYHYAHVVYHCGNISDGATPFSVHCYKSLDGGQTWAFIQGPNHPPADCTGRYGGRGRAVGPDGTLYMSIICQPTAGARRGVAGPGPLYLASSRDEGNTWDYQLAANTSFEENQALLVSSLAVDRKNNVYIGWVNAQYKPMLVVRKGGAWGSPMDVAEPGVTYVNRVAVAVDNPGHVAISYIGSPGGIGGTFNGYLTETWDALGKDPVFMGAPVNDPGKPLESSAYADASTAVKGRTIWLAMSFGPDGTPWAAFHCANKTNGDTPGTTTDITCPNGAAPPDAPMASGIVGRLVSPHAKH